MGNRKFFREVGNLRYVDIGSYFGFYMKKNMSKLNWFFMRR